MNITVTANGGTGPVNPFSMNYPAPAIGATGNGTQTPWGGGIAFLSNNIYFTTNSASQPIGYVSYSNGTVGGAISYLTASSNLKNAPAGGLVAVGNTLYGTEQNSSEAFSITTSGSVTKYALTCPSSGNAGSGSALVYPQTGITTDGSNVFVLCGEVATRTDTTHNTVNEISSTGTVTSCQLNSAGGNTAGPFANGAVYANGVIYSETSFGSAGGGAGGATGGDWIAIPVNPLSNCGHFQEMGNAAITGSGNVWLQPDKNLYSETDNLMAAPAAVGFGSATVGSPSFANGGVYMGQGGGGLAMDGVLGSGFFVGTADRVDAIIHTKWSGGTAIVPNTFLALSSGGTPISVGQCEVAYNAGGGMGAIQLPDGKFAWPHATDGDPAAATQNWLCVLNP